MSAGQWWSLAAGWIGVALCLRLRAGGRWGRSEWACAALFALGWGTLGIVPIVFWARILGCLCY